jgi:hypothetical protein
MRTVSAGPFGIRKINEECEVSAFEGEQLIAGGYAEELPQIAGGMTPEIAARVKELETDLIVNPNIGEDTDESDAPEKEKVAPQSKKKPGKK